MKQKDGMKQQIQQCMRSKEYANDYRYFPEGDLVTINVSDEWIEEIRNTIPELPYEKKKICK